jgi:glycine cleavage system H protein
MACIHHCEIPEDLYYVIEKHVWARPLPDGRVRLGLTAVGYAVLRNSVVAVEVVEKRVGQAVERGSSIALVESLKYIGPVPAPFTGILLCGNEKVMADPELAMRDPYGDGWIAEMQPEDWEAAREGLLTGEAAVSAYRALLEAQKITCE